MNNRNQAWLCLFANLVLTLITVVFVCIFRDEKSIYFRVGPHDNLIIVSISVNTWLKWCLVLFFIALLKSCDVLVNEVGTPILGFSVFNPDKKIITEFSKNELNFLANATFMVNGIRSVLMIVVNVTQVDLAMAGVIMSEVASFFTVRFLLNKKTFLVKNETAETALLFST
jgi:hypothetical protein